MKKITQGVLTPSKSVFSRSLLAASIVAACGFGAATHANATAALAAYNANPALVSVSGLSSGGFMAAQLGIAYSGTFKQGFGVFAGGPDDCARAQSYTACMYNGTPSISSPDANIKSWSGTSNEDSLSNLASRQIYLWTGSADTTVGPNVVAQLKSQLSSYYTAANFTEVTTSGAIHTFPTNFSGSGDNSCSSSVSPYISNCTYDGSGAVLQWMYGSTKLNAPNTGTLGGTVVTFDQTKFLTGNGMDSIGYLYVPAACATGSTVCGVHLAVHGCLQGEKEIGMDYVNNTGYNKWADTNNIIVIYPQAVEDSTSHSTPGNGSVANPNGCWDWIGWYGSNFDEKGGVQMAALVAMVNQVTSGYKGGSTTTTAGGTTTTTAHGTTTTTTTTTTSNAYTQTASATVTNHYIAGRINVTQYNILGAEYGYNTTITLYYCPSLSGWTNHSNCAPLS